MVSEARASSRLCAMHLSPDPKTAAAQGRSPWWPHIMAQHRTQSTASQAHAHRLRPTARVFLRNSPNSLVCVSLSMGVCQHVCLCILHVHARCLWRPERAPDPLLQLELHTECWVPVCGFLDLNLQVGHWDISPPYFLTQGLAMNLEFADWLASFWILLSPPPQLGSQVGTTMPS